MMARWRRLSVRTRLTIWYVALLAGTLTALVGLGLWLATREPAERRRAAASEGGGIAFEVDEPVKAAPLPASG